MSPFYVSGGTLRADARCYVHREADEVLFRSLCAGEYCHVLTSRQMGKSSLMVRTAFRLREAGITPVLLDLTALGQNLTPEQWYRSLVDILGEQLRLEEELEAFWEAHLHTSPVRRLVEALIQVVLPLLRDETLPPVGAGRITPSGHPDGDASTAPPPPAQASLTPYAVRLVLFIDEIDTVQALPFCTDEFFSAIRECHNRRGDCPLLEGLTFCLLGVAVPSDLIQDPRTTPFNIGRRVELADFRPAEAALLADGLAPLGLDAHAVLRRVLYWTGGHPYLTQRFCQALVEGDRVAGLRDVDSVCDSLFLSKRARLQDNNLLFVREQVLRTQLTGYSREETRSAALDLYLRVWRGRKVAEDPADPVAGLLRLAGLVRCDQGQLRLRNRIYTRVFDAEWVRTQLPEAEMLRQRTAYLRGVRRAAAVACAILVMVGSLVFSLVLAVNEKEAALRRLRFTLNALERQTGRATQEARRAEAAEKRERAERLAAERERQGARRLQQVAETARDEAQRQLAQMHLAEGWRKIEAEQPAIGLLWFVEALKLLRGREAEEQRTRIASLLRLTPYPSLTWDHAGQIVFARFSPDSRLVVTASNEGSVELRSVATGQRVGKGLRGIGVPRDACFLPNGGCLVVATRGSAARIWDLRRGNALGTRLRHTAGVTHAALSPDGRHVATASDDRTARVWDVRTCTPILAPLAHAESVWHCAFTPGGGQLLTQAANRQLFLWDLHASPRPTKRILGTAETWETCGTTGALVTGMRGSENSVLLHSIRPNARAPESLDHHGTIQDAAFSPDGRWVAAAGTDRLARVWNTTTHRRISVLSGHHGPVASVTFSPFGSRLSTVSTDRTARVWATASGLPVSPPLPHGGPVLDSVFDPSGRHLVTLGQDGLVRLWNLAAFGRAETEVWAGEDALVTSLHPTPDRWVGTHRGSVRVWRLSSGLPLTDWLAHHDPDHFTRPALSADGDHLLTRIFPRSGLYLWHQLQWRQRQTVSSLPRSQAHRYVALTLDPKAQCLAAGTSDGSLEIRKVRSGERIVSIRGRGAKIETLCFSPDGKRLLATYAGGHGHVWNARDGASVAAPLSHRATIKQGLFSADGRWVATGSEDHTARVWEAATSRPVTGPLPHEAAITAIRFGPSGSSLATAGRDRIAQVWRLPEGTRLGAPMHHRNTITDLAFSPDGRWLATGSEDGTARIWDARSGRPISPYLPVGEEVSRLDFGADGRKLYIGTSRGSLQTWSLQPDMRSIRDLERLAWYLSGHRVDATGALVPVEAATLTRLSHELRGPAPHPPRSRTDQLLAWHRREAAAGEREGAWTATTRHLEPLLRAYPASHSLRIRRAQARSEAGEWAGAADDWKHLRQKESDDPIFWYLEALCRLGANDLARYRQTCGEMLRRAAEVGNERFRDFTAWTCALGPCARNDRLRALALVEGLLKDNPEHTGYLNTRGVLLSRCDRYDDARAMLQQAIRLRGNDGNALDRLFLARALAKLGQGRATDNARAEAEAEVRRLAAAPKSAWEDRLELRLFLRE